MNIERYNSIILDCDGVIFDTNNLKLEAFRKVLCGFDDQVVNNFIKYFRENFGTSRYELTRVFIEDFLGFECSKELFDEILARYGDECLRLYQKASLTKGFLEFVDKYKNKRIFIASGGDETELKTVFKNRGLDCLFVDILGSPKKKAEIVSEIVARETGSIVMIGDANADKIAASMAGIDFIFMKDYSTSSGMGKDHDLNCIDNLSDLI